MADIFNLLHLIRLNDLQIFYAFLSSLSFKGYTHAGSYSRLLIYYDHGSRWELMVTIYRVRIRGSMSSHTLSLRPASFLPRSSCSLRFILETLYAFKHRPASVSVASFCEEHLISRTALYKWLRLLKQNRTLWHRILLELKYLSDRLLSQSPGIPFAFPDPGCFVCGFSIPLPVSFASLLIYFHRPP